jgi:hypothetical protein
MANWARTGTLLLLLVVTSPVQARDHQTHTTTWQTSAAGAAAAQEPVRVGQDDVSDAPAWGAQRPRVLLLDPGALSATRSQVADEAAELAPALAGLRAAAGTALRAGPFSVTEKQNLPPSGDVHDYLSLSVYYWPNPDTPAGLPYVVRDGQFNPERQDTTRYDALTLNRMVRNVEILALAFYLTQEPDFAERAALFLRTWFLDEPTRMHPNFRFAQIRPGSTVETGGGIIESRDFLRVIDAVGLLEESPAWTPADQAALQGWFRQFLTWLRESPPGQRESRAGNNHGTWYDAQVAAIALFTDQAELAQQMVMESAPRRIASQIEPDGRQPLELARTRPLHYSLFNLEAFGKLATIAERVGLDLWRYRTEEGAGIRPALDFVVPYVADTAEWPYLELSPVNAFSEAAPLLHRAALAYQDGPYADLEALLAADRTSLTRLRLTLGDWYVP